MLIQIRRFLQYQYKAVEIRWRTWRSQQEIARAYGTTPPVRPARSAVSRASIRNAIIIVGIIAGLILLIAVAPRLMRAGKTVAHSLSRITLLHNTATVRSQQPVRQAPAPAPKVVQAEQRADVPVVMPDTAGHKLWTVPSPMQYVLLANKASKTLYLIWRNGQHWQVVREYPMAIGKNDGPKRSAGDLKTPEGVYCIIGRKERHELSSIYGPLAYVLNYPNDDDKQAGRTGMGIWVHGTDPDSVPVYSRGCLKLTNDNLRELERFLREGIGTPVVIVYQPDLIDPLKVADYAQLAALRNQVVVRYSEQQAKVGVMLSQWTRAWSARNISEYQRFYDTLGFEGDGLSWRGWRDRKRATFAMYSFIAVDARMAIVTEMADSQAVVKFIQRYSSSGMPARENGKRLELVYIGNNWKIRSENTFAQEELFL